MTRRHPFPAGLFSIFVFALTLVVATDALAQRTRTGGSTYGGSTIDSAIRFFDDNAQITSPSITGVGFDITSATAPGQTVACTFDDGVNPPVNAQCETSVTCKRFEVGTCSAQTGTRTSRMMCPTTTGAGCTGSVTVTIPGTTPFTRHFAVDPNIATNGACNSEFPSIPGVLGRRVIGEIVQTCNSPTWSASDAVLSEVVRDDVEPGQTTFFSSTSWVDALEGTCNANNGFPTGACSNDGGTWFTVTANPIVNPATCAASAAALTCGQQVVDGVVQPGPAPRECRQDANGQCQCRCARCTPQGTLVNLGERNLFVLADAKAAAGSRPWAAACEVTVTGN